MKTATLAWYADNLDYVEGKTSTSGSLTQGFSIIFLNGAKSEIIKYLGNEGLKDNYSFSNGVNANEWFVWCHVTDSKVLDKLISRKDTVGLVAASNNWANATVSTDLTTSAQYVGLAVR